MTGLFDGVSILLEACCRGAGDRPAAAAEAASPARASGSAASAAPTAVVRIGLTIPGSESGAEELHRGAAEAARIDPFIEPVPFGREGGDAAAAHRDMEAALAGGRILGAVTFHYPFPIGIATVGHLRAPGNGRDLFIATTTGTASPDRVEGLVQNAIAGVAAAKAFGLSDPAVGFLNLDGAARALRIVRELAARGYGISLAASSRGDELLRGNDILAGTVDVLVCDSLTGNAVVKLLGAFTTGGRMEVAGSGYGPGVGDGAAPVGIISRASGAPVVANALLLMAKMVRAGLPRMYAAEKARAESAGLTVLLGGHRPAPAAGPPRKSVHHEIGGIDVLEIEPAIALLASKGIYAEPAMGCTGPVVLVAPEDAEAAASGLREARLL